MRMMLYQPEMGRKETINMSQMLMVTKKHFQTKSQITTHGGTANHLPLDFLPQLTKMNQKIL